MAQTWIRTCSFVAFGLAVLSLPVGTAISADTKTPTVKEIMSAGHKGDKALMAKVAAAVKGGKWDDAQKAAAKMAENGAALGKNTVKKGDAKSWETLAQKYADSTKALADATDKKDAAAVKSSMQAIGTSCKECHTAHRGK